MLLLALGIGGCAGSGESRKPPDERYGHRYADEGPEGRATLTVVSPGAGASYFTYPAPIGSVTVRVAPSDSAASGSRLPVEVLIKGALPNACMVLHEATREQSGHLIRVYLRVRQPQGEVCRRLRRPYRFYLPLGGLAPGDYSLTVNDDFYAFTVEDPSS